MTVGGSLLKKATICAAKIDAHDRPVVLVNAVYREHGQVDAYTLGPVIN